MHSTDRNRVTPSICMLSSFLSAFFPFFKYAIHTERTKTYTDVQKERKKGTIAEKHAHHTSGRESRDADTQ